MGPSTGADEPGASVRDFVFKQIATQTNPFSRSFACVLDI
jgi:hypothetical protein